MFFETFGYFILIIGREYDLTCIYWNCFMERMNFKNLNLSKKTVSRTCFVGLEEQVMYPMARYVATINCASFFYSMNVTKSKMSIFKIRPFH